MFYLTLHDAMLHILEKHPEPIPKKSDYEKVKKSNEHNIQGVFDILLLEICTQYYYTHVGFLQHKASWGDCAVTINTF